MGFHALDELARVIVAVVLFTAIGAGLAGQTVHRVVGKAVDGAIARGQLAQAARVIVGGELLAAIGLDALHRAAPVIEVELLTVAQRASTSTSRPSGS